MNWFEHPTLNCSQDLSCPEECAFDLALPHLSLLASHGPESPLCAVTKRAEYVPDLHS